MEFVDLNLTINVSFGTLTMDQYKSLEIFFKCMVDDTPINNEELIKTLSLDKRPFAVSGIKLCKPDLNNLNIRNAEINLIC